MLMEDGWSEEDDKLMIKIAYECKFDWKKTHTKFKEAGGHKSSPTFLKKRYHIVKKDFCKEK